jgi:hypothetical protein
MPRDMLEERKSVDVVIACVPAETCKESRKKYCM